MDIGTAKPTLAERADVVHHCIDLVEPTEEFSVSDYQQAFRRAISTIDGRPLLVAGTGLYLVAAIDGLEVPGQWPEVRAELGGDVAELHARLQELDPVAAERIDPSNARRIVRALEVTIGSGRPFSSYGPGIGAHPPTDATLIGLRWSRPVLAQRIERRVHGMIEAGLVDEVRAVQAAGPLSRTARQALGYKELLAEPDLATAVAQIVIRTQQFAVRQARWFRRDPRVRWVDVSADPVAEVAPAVIDALRHP
jgi:tRNA dimethylallyltransferase